MKKSKVILSLIFVLIFAFSAFVLPACTASCNPKEPNNQTETNPGGNPSTNPGGNPSTNPGGEKTEYSDILKKIMTDDYYLSLMYKLTDNGYKISSDMKPVPYKFLRQQGHDVDDYLNDTLNAFASSYIYKNDNNHIYVSVKAENVSSHEHGNYYSNYVLKYALTNQEYEEYTTLANSGCVQSLLFIQELDNQKTPEVVSHVNIAKSTYNKMIEKYVDSTLNLKNFERIEIDINYADMEKMHITLREISYSHMSSSSIGNAELTYKKATWPEIYENNVIYLTSPTSVNYDLNAFETSLKNITSFNYGYEILGTNPYSYDLFDKVNNK